MAPFKVPRDHRLGRDSQGPDRQVQRRNLAALVESCRVAVLGAGSNRRVRRRRAAPGRYRGPPHRARQSNSKRSRRTASACRATAVTSTPAVRDRRSGRGRSGRHRVSRAEGVQLWRGGRASCGHSSRGHRRRRRADGIHGRSSTVWEASTTDGASKPSTGWHGQRGDPAFACDRLRGVLLDENRGARIDQTRRGNALLHRRTRRHVSQRCLAFSGAMRRAASSAQSNPTSARTSGSS